MQIGPYEILEELGRGGMGVVYRARRPELDREVALKVIEAGAAGPAWVERFRREAAAASRLAAHPGIAGAHDVGEEDGRCWYAMELVEGEPLDRVIARQDLTPEQAAAWIAQAAQAMAHAHDHGVLHRDLKPANILIAAVDGRARVTDFGLAAVQAAGPDAVKLTQSAEILGTPDYMPPEQARGEECDGTADVYALGATLYELLAGSPPFAGDSLAEVLGRLLRDAPPPLPPGVPEPLRRIVRHALAKSPGDRYPTALALAADLHRFLGNERVHAPSLRSERPARVVVLGVVALALAAAGLAWWWQRDRASARTARERTARRESARQITEAYRLLVARTVDDMRALEDHWHGPGGEPPAAALQRVEAECNRVARTHPASGMPRAWRAIAQWYAAPGKERWAEVEAAARAVPGDPYPEVEAARVLLARYADGLALPEMQFERGEDARVGRELEGRDDTLLREAAERLQRNARHPALVGSARSTELGHFIDGAVALAEERFGDADRALSPLDDDPLLEGDAQTLRALALLSEGRFTDVVAVLARTVQRNWQLAIDRSAAAWTAEAFRLEAQGGEATEALEHARRLIEQAVAQRPQHVRLRHNRGVVRLAIARDLGRRGEDCLEALQQAADDFEAVAAQDNDAIVWHGAATAHALKAMELERRRAPGKQVLPELERALAAYERSLAVDDGYLFTRLGRSSTLRMRSRWLGRATDRGIADLRESLQDAQKALAIMPDRLPSIVQVADGWRFLAGAQGARGEPVEASYAAAIKAFSAVIERSPDPMHRRRRAECRISLAQAREAAGEPSIDLYAGAVEDARVAAQQAPRDHYLQRVQAVAALGVARIRLLAGRPATEVLGTAEAAADRLLALRPDHAESYLIRAQVEAIRGNDAACREILERGLKRLPGNERIKAYLAGGGRRR